MVPSVVATSTYSLWWGCGFKSCRNITNTTNYLFISLILCSLHHWEGAEVRYLVRSCKHSHKRLTCIMRSKKWRHLCLHGMLLPPLYTCCWQPSSSFQIYPSSSAWIDHQTSFDFWPYYLHEPLPCNHWKPSPLICPALLCPITFSGVMWFWYQVFHFMLAWWRWVVVHPKFFGVPYPLIIPKAKIRNVSLNTITQSRSGCFVQFFLKALDVTTAWTSFAIMSTYFVMFCLLLIIV